MKVMIDGAKVYRDMASKDMNYGEKLVDAIFDRAAKESSWIKGNRNNMTVDLCIAFAIRNEGAELLDNRNSRLEYGVMPLIDEFFEKLHTHSDIRKDAARRAETIAPYLIEWLGPDNREKALTYITQEYELDFE